MLVFVPGHYCFVIFFGAGWILFWFFPLVLVVVVVVVVVLVFLVEGLHFRDVVVLVCVHEAHAVVRQKLVDFRLQLLQGRFAGKIR